MGLGKSLVAIAVTGALYKQCHIHRVLVVAPLSVLGVWKEEFEKFADFDYSLVILTGSVEKKTQSLQRMTGDTLQVAVLNYESTWRIGEAISHWKPDLVIADEGHRIKTHNTACSKAMHRIGVRAAYRLLLTGTPITNKPMDIFSQYKFLNPLIFGTSFYRFRNRYFNMEGYMQYTPVLKPSMEAELLRLVHRIAYRATKAECLDLPETLDIVRFVELEPSARTVYKALAKEGVAQLGGGVVTAVNILAQLLRLSQCTGGFLKDDENNQSQQVSSAKLDALADILDTALADGQKLVIIARFIPEIEAIREMLDQRGVDYSLVIGGVTNRAEQVSRFQSDLSVPVFVGQIATAGMGITLTAASAMVFFSLDYSSSNHEQCRARIHRVGQKQNCTYIYLTAKGTVDEKVLKALHDKADLAKVMIDEYRTGVNPF